jgi:hypothetical protein
VLRGLHYGAEAPPVGLLPAADSPPLPAAPFEAAFSFSFSLAAGAPPVGLASAGVSLAGGVLLSLAGVSLAAEDVSLALLVVLVVVAAVEVFCEAAASALVFVGGEISGVLFGTASETLVPPHALTVRPHSSAAQAASATRGLTTGPCACRTWDSR